MNIGSPKNRISVLAICMLAVMLVFIIRLMQWQIVEGKQWQNVAQRTSTHEQIIESSRGEIVDRNGVPLVINEVSFDVVIDKALVAKKSENDIISALINILTTTGEDWNDDLPITKEQPYQFIEGKEKEVEKLKNRIGVGQYVDAPLVIYHLKERYDIDTNDAKRARDLCGVRYSMETKDFSLANPYIFSNDIKNTTATVIMENSMKLKGAYISENSKRSYPNGTTAPHIIGQVGPIYENERDIYTKDKGYNLNDVVGKSGIEKTMEGVLRGKDGKRQIVLDNKGAVTEILENETAEPGNTVVLTIDAKMQQVATQALEKKIKQLNANARAKRGKEADAGVVVVVDVKTGEVLTSANYPTYDLANYNKDFATLNEDKRRPLWDRALLGQYAPGSVFKPVVGVAALSEGLMKPSDTVYCGHTYTYFKDYQPTCVGNHGPIEITRALQESCNIYFFDVGRRLGVDTINKYAHELGLGAETGIELPENVGRLSTPELFSSLRNGEPWTPGNVLQASIGQLDTRFTPMQIANYTATIANKGKRMDLNIIKSVESYNFDKTISKTEPKVAFNVKANEQVFDSIKAGMVKASRVGTAAAFFKDYPIEVASKTGSPQVSQEITNSVFTCFAPANDPQIAVTVVIEKGGHGLYGAPVAKEVLDYYFANTTETEKAEPNGEMLP